MKNFIRNFWYEEEGMGTIEIVIIIAILVAIALIFKSNIKQLANRLMSQAFHQDGLGIEPEETPEYNGGQVKDPLEN